MKIVFLILILAALGLIPSVHADPLTGTVTTIYSSESDPRETAMMRDYADQIGASGDHYLTTYQQRYKSPQPLKNAVYEIVIKQSDGSLLKVGESRTDASGQYSVDVPQQYQADLANGKVALVFYADNDRADITKPVWAIGALSQSKYLKSGEMQLSGGGGNIEIQRDDTPYSHDFTAGNNVLTTLDIIKNKVESAKPYMPENVRNAPDTSKATVFYPGDEKIGLSIGNLVFTGETLMGYNATNGSKWIEVKSDDPLKIINEEKFDFFSHEYGHYIFSGLVGGDYASYAPAVAEHDMGAITKNDKFALNEGFAHFFAGVSQDLPQTLYRKDMLSFGSLEYDWNWRTQNPAKWGSDPANKKSQLLQNMTATINRLEEKVNSYEGLTMAERNTIEGYFTQLLNEIYFGGEYGKDEALGKIMAVIAVKKPKSMDEFIAGWREMFPSDSDKLDRALTRMDKKVFQDIRDYIAKKRDLIKSLGEEGNVPAPVQASYVPGGLAVDPRDWKQVYVTDNTNGRLLWLTPGDFGVYRQLSIVQGLDTPGDVDMADFGRSLVISERSKLRKISFGLTAQITGSNGQPLSGADVVISGAFPTITTRSDANGAVSVMNILKPNLSDYLVYITVSQLGKTQRFPLYLNLTGQTFVSLEFTAN